MDPSNLGGSTGRGQRHDHATISRLEAIFRECQYPDENRRNQISEELGLTIDQVKFWFQNKRVQQKAMSEQIDNNALRQENEAMQLENLLLRESLQNTICRSCRGLPLGSVGHELHLLQALKAENIQLAEEYEKVYKLLETNGINPALPPTGFPSHDQHIPILRSTPSINQDIPVPANDCYIPDPPSNDATLDYNSTVPVLDHSIPAVASDPWLGQDNPPLIPTPVSTMDQDINIPPLGQDTSTLPQDPDPPSNDATLYYNSTVPVLDHSIPAVASDPWLGQDTPPLIPTPIPTMDQDINIPPLGQDTSTLPQDPDPPSNDATLDYSSTVPVLDHSIPAITSDPWLGQDNLPLIPTPIPTMDQDINIPPLGQDTSTLPQDPDQELDALHGILNNDMIFQSIVDQSTDLDNAMMSQIANNGIEELLKLLDMNQPFWSVHDWKLVLKSDNYQSILGRRHCLPGPHSRIESSKDSAVVHMNAKQLVQVFMNSDKWADMFPTIVTKARTIQVLETGLVENPSGALLLMNAEMHILSHLVPTREFYFLRYCKQTEEGAWVIADVSIDSSEYQNIVPRVWRRPSGCLIEQLSQELCRVSWVEHAEVDDKMETHELFRDVISNNNAYGAERWVSTLTRMSERFACASPETIPSCDESEGEILSVEGKKSVMHLAHRMVKTFFRTLDMRDSVNLPCLTRMNNDEVTVTVRKNNSEPDLPQGLILTAATSFLLPHSPQHVFDFLIDNKERAKWEPLWYGKPENEIQHISTGNNPANFISIMKPLGPSYSNTVVLQESYADALGSMMVYSAFDTETMNFAMRGEDTSHLLVLPSGFTISGDGQSNTLEEQLGESKGSLVTLILQVLVSSTPSKDTIDMEFVDSISTLLSSTMEKIKTSLSCSNYIILE